MIETTIPIAAKAPGLFKRQHTKVESLFKRLYNRPKRELSNTRIEDFLK